MAHGTVSLSLMLELPLSAEVLFDAIVGELSSSLEALAMKLVPGPAGKVLADGREIARVVAWEPARVIRLEWLGVSWDQTTTAVEVRLEPTQDGARLTLSHRGWEQLIGGASEAPGWFASEVGAPLLKSFTPQRLGDWLTDRRARRPSGAGSRGVYADPIYHYPNFKVMLAELALTASDHLIEIGCGGGAMLKQALKSGCSAGAIDHSIEMVKLARQNNDDQIAAGRLVIEQADANHLPFADSTFTAAAMTGVLGFLPDGVAAFKELRRVLRSGGRMVVLGADPAMRGTPAAPEPIASRLHFYTDHELQQLATDAGFAEAQVVRRDLFDYAREVGVPEEHLGLFKNAAPFLIARK
jgi:ubiquinone/menaquinone biosynthesis C-methylase UbiE